MEKGGCQRPRYPGAVNHISALPSICSATSPGPGLVPRPQARLRLYVSDKEGLTRLGSQPCLEMGVASPAGPLEHSTKPLTRGHLAQKRL